MLNLLDILPDSFDYDKYMMDFNLPQLVNENLENIPKDASRKFIPSPTFGVDPNNKTPYPTEFDDLCRLH